MTSWEAVCLEGLRAVIFVEQLTGWRLITCTIFRTASILRPFFYWREDRAPRIFSAPSRYFFC
jgi:hypothetical protein